MTIVVPMAGSGARFVEAGYTDPKPMIKVDGVPMIHRVCGMFHPKDKYVFVGNEFQLNRQGLWKSLLEMNVKSTVVPIGAHRLGPVYTVSKAFKHIPDKEEVIVSYCDGVLKFDLDDFRQYVRKQRLDGCLFTHRGFHPHTLSPTTKMAFCKLDPVWGLLDEIKEKSCYTDNPMNEHASSGVYWFKSGALMKRYFERAMKEDQQHNGEFYVTLVYNLLANDGLRVGVYQTPVAILGTPEELRNYEAWMTLTRSHVQTGLQAAMCFDYWRRFNEKVTVAPRRRSRRST